MIYEPLLYPNYGADLDDPNFINLINDAVTTSGNTVIFHLAEPYPELIFLQVWAQAWASVVCKQWAIDQGCWDGVYTQESLLAYHDPDVSPLMDPAPVAMGTGPYKFDAWVQGAGGYWTIIKNDDYWGGWPGFNYGLGVQARGYFTRITSQYTAEWSTRRLQYLAGDSDFCAVPRLYMGDVWAQPGVQCVYPNFILQGDGFFFNFNISLTSRYLSPPFTSALLDYGQLDEGSFPPDFFNDIDVRKAIAYCIDYYEYIDVAFLGEAGYPLTPIIEGLPYRLSDEWYAANEWYLDLAMAETHFRAAWGGQLWETGFTLTITYNEGNIPRRVMAEMLEANIESLNPLFHIDLLEVAWGEVYIPELFTSRLPLYIIGWLADYADPHNWAHPFQHSHGAFSGPSSYYNPTVDALIEEGGFSTDPARREEIYAELQQLYIDDVPSIVVTQPVGRSWQRTWVQGWYLNTLHPGFFGRYWEMWKEDLPIEDINDSGAIDIFDIVAMATSFGAYYAVGDVHPDWDSHVDLNLDQVIDIFDVVQIAKEFGTTSPPWTPP
jgi:peptide/nickel transport system substrate-binding protein